MWTFSYNSILFTIWGLKLALCCSLKFYICFGCVRFQESSERSWNFTFFSHGKSWKVMKSHGIWTFKKSMNPVDVLPCLSWCREPQGILACCNPIPPLVRQNLNELMGIIKAARERPLAQVRSWRFIVSLYWLVVLLFVSQCAWTLGPHLAI